MIEQVAVFVRVVFDDGAVEARGGHVVEGDADAVHVQHLIVVKRCVRITQPIAAAAAAGGEGDAEDAAVELLLEMLGGRGGDRNVHSVAAPRTSRASASSRLNQSRSSFVSSSSRSSSTMCARLDAARYTRKPRSMADTLRPSSASLRSIVRS